MVKNRVLIFLVALMLILNPVLALANNTDNILNVELSANGIKDVIVYLKDDIHLSGEIAKESSNDEHRDINYIEGLKDAAQNSQSRVIEILKENLESGKVIEYTPFYITNAVHVKADLDVLKEINALPEVSKIYFNDNVEMELSTISSLSTPNEVKKWNHDELNLPRVRDELGLDGSGVTIGFIDSGVDWTHPSIKTKWRGYNVETGETEAKYSWLDLVGDSELPTDEYSHGTAIVSIAVAGSGENPNLMGIAPGAKWIAARAFVEKNTTNVNIIKAAEWMLAPGGDPSMAPDIINNSWGGESSANPWFRDIIVAWKSVGILPVFAAGNSIDVEAKPGSIENPANLLNTLSVGAVDVDLKLAKFSKRGPSAFDNTGTIIKPELVAPGNNVRAAIINGGYAKMYGTSIATPHISGLAALMKEQNPNATPSIIEKALINSATPLVDEEYPESPNMGYGYGLPDAYKAVKAMKVADNYTRISGLNRFETAIKISNNYYPQGADVVYLTGGYAYTDALVMSPLTNIEDGPVLLAEKDEVNKSTIEEIKRLNPSKIYVIGGRNTISENAVDALSKEVNAEVERIQGKDRYETSLVIAKRVNEHKEVSEAFMVNGYSEVDAISISGIAKDRNIPIILTDGKSLSDDHYELFNGLNIESSTVIGGPTTVSDKLIENLSEIGYSTERIGGDDRFETSLMINKKYISEADSVMIANGLKPVDALTAGAIAGSYRMPTILIVSNSIPAGVKEYIDSIGVKSYIILGGLNSITDETVHELIK